jgi:hypothetical protein
VLSEKKSKSSFGGLYYSGLILLLFLTTSVSAFDDVALLFTPTVKPPIFLKPKVIYEVDFIFNKCPHEYTLYYDRIQKKMVIDIYGAVISWLDTTRTGSFSGELNIKNVETAMSLSGQKGQILFTLQKEWKFEQGWHYECSAISPTTLQVKLWIELRPAVVVKNKNKELGNDTP